MNQPVRFAALGAAQITPRALLYPARSIPGVEISGIAARSLARAQAMADKFGIPRASSSYAEVVEDERTDAVYIALPAAMHFESAAAALRAGKHVLCEKPLTTTEAEAVELVRLGEEMGRRVLEAYHYRYHPYTQQIATLVHDVVGEIVAAEVVFSHIVPPGRPVYWDKSLGGGATFHLGGYGVDGVRTIFGLEPELEHAAACWTDGVDVMMTADLRLPSGAPVRLRSSMTSPIGFENWLWVRGIEAELFATNYVVPQFSAKHREYASCVRVQRYGEEPLLEFPDTSVLSYTVQLEAFVDAIHNESSFSTSRWDCVHTVRILEAILRLARESGEVGPPGQPAD